MCNNELKVKISFIDRESNHVFDTVRYEYSRAVKVLASFIEMYDLPSYSSVKYDVADFTTSLSMGMFRFYDEDGEIIPDYIMFTDMFENHNL